MDQADAREMPHLARKFQEMESEEREVPLGICIKKKKSLTDQPQHP